MTDLSIAMTRLRAKIRRTATATGRLIYGAKRLRTKSKQNKRGPTGGEKAIQGGGLDGGTVGTESGSTNPA